MTGGPGLIGSFFGGISVFFSVWQLCIMQFSPFYIAYLLTVYFLIDGSGGRARSAVSPLVLTAVGLGASFSLVFAVLSDPGFASSHALFSGLRGLKSVSGFFILAVGTLMIILAVLGRFDTKAYVPTALSPLVGASFAIAYSPCIPPVLSEILNFSGMPGNSLKGLVLLFVYAAGVCSATTLVAAVAILYFRLRQGRRKTRTSMLPPVLSSLVFMVIGLLLVLGLMLRYKRFLVNIF